MLRTLWYDYGLAGRLLVFLCIVTVIPIPAILVCDLWLEAIKEVEEEEDEECYRSSY